MNYNDKTQLNNEVIEMLKPILKSMYIKWSSKYTSAEIRQEIMMILIRHNNEKICEVIRRKKKKTHRIKNMKNKIELLEQQRLDKQLMEELK